MTERSSKKLSDNIRCCSLQEGKFIFLDLELQPEYVTENILLPLIPNNCCCTVTHCSVATLQVTLSLNTSSSSSSSSFNTDTTSNNNNNESSSSTTFLWNLANNKISLQVQLDLSGIRIELSFLSDDDVRRQVQRKQPIVSPKFTTIDTITTTTTNSNDFWMSCVDTVISSLRVNVENLTLSFVDDHPTTMGHPKLTLTLQSATYCDHTASITTNNKTTGSTIPTTKQQPSTELIMHKVIDFSSFSVTFSSSSPSLNTHTFATADGHAQLNLRVFQNNHTGTIFHDVSVALHQQWQITPLDDSIIIPSNNHPTQQQQQQQPLLIVLQRLNSILSSIESCTSTTAATTLCTDNNSMDTSKHVTTVNSSITTTTAITKNNIMNQLYTEARALVEQNEVKGGILIPSNSTTSTVEYDAFFDCTDRSFSVYLSLVRPNTDEKHSSSTRIHFHLTEVTILVLRCCTITFGDLSMLGAISNQETTCTVEIGLMEWDSTSTGTENNMIRFTEVSFIFCVTKACFVFLLNAVPLPYSYYVDCSTLSSFFLEHLRTIVFRK